jgi:hypothetical protein
MPRAENKTTPKVVGDMLYYDEGGLTVGSVSWFAWLTQEQHTTFYYESPAGSFTARKEIRKGYRWYWYAYRRAGPHSKLHKCYLGKSEQLTAQRLADVARQLAEQVQS